MDNKEAYIKYKNEVILVILGWLTSYYNPILNLL
jgi:hypothetical protein